MSPDPQHVGADRPWRTTYRAAKAGLVPAEALSQTLRHRLFRELRDSGRSIIEIAALTMTSTYTVGRILGQDSPPGRPRSPEGGL